MLEDAIYLLENSSIPEYIEVLLQQTNEVIEQISESFIRNGINWVATGFEYINRIPYTGIDEIVAWIFRNNIDLITLPTAEEILTNPLALSYFPLDRGPFPMEYVIPNIDADFLLQSIMIEGVTVETIDDARYDERYIIYYTNLINNVRSELDTLYAVYLEYINQFRDIVFRWFPVSLHGMATIGVNNTGGFSFNQGINTDILIDYLHVDESLAGHFVRNLHSLDSPYTNTLETIHYILNRRYIRIETLLDDLEMFELARIRFSSFELFDLASPWESSINGPVYPYYNEIWAIMSNYLLRIGI